MVVKTSRELRIRVQKIPLAKKVFCVSPGIIAAKKRKSFVTKLKKFNPLRLTMKMKFNYKNATKFVIRLVPGNRALILRALGCMGGVRPLMRLLLSEKGVVRMKTTLKFLFSACGKGRKKGRFWEELWQLNAAAVRKTKPWEQKAKRAGMLFPARASFVSPLPATRTVARLRCSTPTRVPVSMWATTLV